MVRPNVVYFLSDDHSRGAVGLYADRLKDVMETPNIDNLGKEGIYFKECAAENSICSPGRAAAYSGQFTNRHGVFMLGKAMRDPQNSWPKILDDSGYDTAVIGKWHLDNQPETVFPGFSAITGVTGKANNQGEWFDPHMRVHMRGRETTSVSHPGGFSSDVYTDMMLDWLETKRDPSKPFAISLNYKQMHSSMEYPDRYLNYKSDLRDFHDPKSLLDKVTGCGKTACESGSFITGRLYEHLFLESGAYKKDYIDKDKRTGRVPRDNNENDLQQRYEHYALKMIRSVKAMDDGVGRIVKYLEENGMMENTIIVYTTDQGYFLGEHGLHGKRTVLDPTMMIPLIFNHKGKIPRGLVSNSMVQNVDEGPTILDMCGVSIPDAMQGKSMKSICYGGEDKWHTDTQFFGYYQNDPYQCGLRGRRYTYCRVNKKGNYQIDFYDRQNDPEQRKNEHRNPEYADAIQDMSNQLDAKLLELGYNDSNIPGGSGWQRSSRAFTVQQLDE